MQVFSKILNKFWKLKKKRSNKALANSADFEQDRQGYFYIINGWIFVYNIDESLYNIIIILMLKNAILKYYRPTTSG